MERIADRYRERGVLSAFVYVREAHPGELRPHHRDLADKLARAREMVEELGLRRLMLVDDLSGSLHRAYGLLPNMTYVIERLGRVAYRASWTDPNTIELAVERLLAEEEARGRRERLLPYYVEWEPASEAFLSALLERGGEHAADEFVAAAKRAVEPRRLESLGPAAR
jgi:hypothetical protein